VRRLEGGVPCADCPCRTPFRADPETFRQARNLYFENPLDPGIEQAVITLLTGGVETFESCEGGPGHSFPEPTVKFEGATSEGFRALALASAYGLPVYRLRRVWGIRKDGFPHGPWWEMTFSTPGPWGKEASGA
jgi:hypothetical protein